MIRRALPLIVVALTVHTASACSVPVFRYALEHWLPDPFMVVVFHRGELTDAQIALLEQLDARDAEDRPTANVMVKAIDVDQETEPSLRKLWELQGTDTVPWIAVHAPVASGPPQRIWGGEFSADVVNQLLESPARQELAQRLITGDSVVWAFLESGDRTDDDAAYARLTSELARLQTTLRLPDIEEADFGDLSVVPESLRMAFSALRVSRDDPQELQFINMLLHAGGVGKDAAADVPIAVPIFGRGRAFDGLIGENLTEKAIEDSCRFLTGACQCTVKRQNPGIDLLISFDWDAGIEPSVIEDGDPPPLVGLQAFAPDKEEPRSATVADAVGASTTIAGPDQSSGAVAAPFKSPATGRDSGASSTRGVVSETKGIDVSVRRNMLLILGALAAVVIVSTIFLSAGRK